MARIAWSPVTLYRKFSLGDAIFLIILIAFIYAISSLNLYYTRPEQTLSFDLSPTKLPLYSLFSLLRMIFAYCLSLIFSIVYGYAAAYNKRLEKILVPLLDILQSIPVLSFLPPVFMAVLTLFPNSRIGLEITSIILIFTGQVWNMVFSFYHSLISIPKELREAADITGLNKWQRFWHLELPFSAIGLLWNSMMSFAGGWFFLMACEMFTLMNQNFLLPGLGSYLSMASLKGDIGYILWGLASLVALIILLDQLVWRPLSSWVKKFKVEFTEGEEGTESTVLLWYRRSRILSFLGRKVFAPLNERLDRFFRIRSARKIGEPEGFTWVRIFNLVISTIFILLIFYGLWGLISLFMKLPLSSWGKIFVSALATLARVASAVLVGLLWTLPVGVKIGTNPRLARILQPIVQIVASVPATALFPIVLLFLINLAGGLNLASVLLMLLGTQWYLLFNIIAGATSIPKDLLEAASILRLKKWDLWRNLIFPGIFPYLVTGGITAMGGAFNASIVSEYIIYGGKVIKTVGLGSLITESSTSGNNALLAASTVTMALMVVLINRLFWKRLFKLSEERYT
ncbi:MAG: ABC transporter permease subunit [Caldiserica bacterium]|jgi:NitT/TauT family transport system permease protein|nr:ABC transporter permease subunit [Caldisericota bacterium]MDH7562187.1 ABC transporter permease subunit [Caldisericota bacterium]